jgi:predicted DsbA family dithiol-disulfide isomerase
LDEGQGDDERPPAALLDRLACHLDLNEIGHGSAREHFASAEDVAQARAYGIQGVPFFVIQNKYGIEGAQQPESFVHAFETVLAELVGAGTAAANLTANEGA